MEALYNDYTTYLRSRFGGKVMRIALDAGFSCPTRDGTKSRGGCLFCNEEGSRSPYADPNTPLIEQLRKRIAALKEKKKIEKFIAYFQAFSNTYASIEKLKDIYDTVIPFREVVGITIGTRPDVIDRKKLALITTYAKERDVWIEYGVQTMHEKTLKLLQRHHTFEDFKKAAAMTKEFNLCLCAHVILGLPNETERDMIETADTLSKLKINGIKIHLFHILRGSRLEKEYARGTITLLSQDAYVALVCAFLEHLSPEIVIQRLTGEGAAHNHRAPAWARNKTETINRIRARLRERGTRQGAALL